ncbi:MAG TPA: energy transducer TonB [Candidatus Paceibacterota bacterium]
MFEQTFVNQGKTNKGSTLAFSAFIQVLFVCFMILLPIIFTDVLEPEMLSGIIVAPPPPSPPPAPPPEEIKRVIVKKVPPKKFNVDFVAPIKIPVKINLIKDAPEDFKQPTIDISVPTNNSFVESVGFGIPESSVSAPAPPPSTPAPKPIPEPNKPEERQRISSGVMAAKIVKQPQPQYPSLALKTRVQGKVVFRAIIGKDGRIKDLRLISGHPLLVLSATNAVKQWEYRPTTLSNEPVEVETEIEVVFVIK